MRHQEASTWRSFVFLPLPALIFKDNQNRTRVFLQAMENGYEGSIRIVLSSLMLRAAQENDKIIVKRPRLAGSLHNPKDQRPCWSRSVNGCNCFYITAFWKLVIDQHIVPWSERLTIIWLFSCDALRVRLDITILVEPLYEHSLLHG